MRFVPAATVAVALLAGTGTVQAARYCDPYRPFVCIDQPDPPSVTYIYPPRTPYTYRIEPASPPPPQFAYEYRAPPPVTVHPQPVYPPQSPFSVPVK